MKKYLFSKLLKFRSIKNYFSLQKVGIVRLPYSIYQIVNKQFITHISYIGMLSSSYCGIICGIYDILQNN